VTAGMYLLHKLD